MLLGFIIVYRLSRKRQRQSSELRRDTDAKFGGTNTIRCHFVSAQYDQTVCLHQMHFNLKEEKTINKNQSTTNNSGSVSNDKTFIKLKQALLRRLLLFLSKLIVTKLFIIIYGDTIFPIYSML